MKKSVKKCKGIALLELMISMTIGTLICAASLQIFLIFKQLWMKQQAMARIQENARVMNFLLGEAIHRSGKLGCNAIGSGISHAVFDKIEAKAVGLDPFVRLMGIKASDLPLNHPKIRALKNRIDPQHEVLWIKLVKKRYPLLEPTMGENGFLLVKGDVPDIKGKIIVISDCRQGDFLRAHGQNTSSRGLTKIYISTPLSKYYAKESEVGIFSSVLYYVGDTKRKNATGVPIYALYSTDLNGRTLELIEGVEDLKIDYLFNENGHSWNDVVGVKVRALLTSVEDGLAKPAPKDRLMRMWWTFEWPIKGRLA